MKLTATRCLVLLALASCPATPPPRTVQKAKRETVVGAIRWDAWYGDVPGHDVGLQVERSLGPMQWHYRLPFYAREVSSTEVHVRGNMPDVMDREIAFARGAGLDYWAFVMYAPDDPSTQGLELYLRSEHKDGLRFAMIVQPYTFGDADIDRLVGYFALDHYQRVTVANHERPLVFLLGPKPNDAAWHTAKESVATLRKKAVAAGLESPYIVHQWGWDGAKDVVSELGLDAESAYAVQFDDEAAPFATLAKKTERKWDEWRTFAPVVPIVMTGWDRRPRVQHPVSWEAPDKPGAISRYYAAPTPAELEAHLRSALDWCAAHRDAQSANAILIYAWNEIDEGGWLVPSLWPNQDSERLNALSRALR